MSSRPQSPSKSEVLNRKGPVPVLPTQASQSEMVENLEEGVQEVHEELRKATISQITLIILAVLAICYFAKLVLVTIFASVLIAFGIVLVALF